MVLNTWLWQGVLLCPCPTALLIPLRDQNCSESYLEEGQGWTPTSGWCCTQDTPHTSPNKSPALTAVTPCILFAVFHTSCPSVLSNNLYYQLLGELLGSVMDNPAFLCCLLLNKPCSHALALGLCCSQAGSGQHCPWPQGCGWNCLTAPQWSTDTAAGGEWLHPACIHHLALQKYRVIVIEQYHMINTFPPEILVPQRLGMMYEQASPWHFPPSSRLLSCDIFLWRHIRQISGEEGQEWTYILIKGKKQQLFKLIS